MGEEIVRKNGIESPETSPADDKTESDVKPEKELTGQNRETFDTPVLESKPPNYLLLAICTTLFVNPLLGIVALVIAIQADNEYIHGNTPKSRRLGRIAKILCIVAIITTIVIIVIVSAVLNA